VHEALKKGYLVHPFTGDEIEDFKSNTYMIFNIADKLKKLIGGYEEVK